MRGKSSRTPTSDPRKSLTMDQKNPLFATISLLMLMSLAFSSCKGNGAATMTTDSIVKEDAFKKSNGELCKIKTTVVIYYPEEYKDKGATQELNELFCKSVLKAPDNVKDIKTALNHYAKSIISQNSPLEVDENAPSYSDEDFEDIDVDNFEISVRITEVYNKNDLISFCCEKIVKKNNKETSVSHHYVNLDLKTMKKLTYRDLFLNDRDELITQMLRSKLMEQEGVKDEEELNNLGYFNLQNLYVTNNFYFSDNGITWCFEPGVIAVPAIGETSLLLPFEELMRFKCEDSALNRI